MVAIDFVIWPMLASLIVDQLVAVHAALLSSSKYVAVIVIMFMGDSFIVSRVERLQALDQFTEAGFLPGIIAGLLIITGNPKAILFYIGVLLRFLM